LEILINIILGGVKMKNKKLIICLCAAVAIIAAYNCTAEENQTKTERIISQRRQEIEQSFMNRILELQLRAASEIRILEVAETSKPNWADITKWAEFAETVLQINGLECEPLGLVKVTAKTPAERLAVALSRIARRKNDILNRSEFEAFKLENQKEHTLSAELAEHQKPLGEKPLTPESKETQGLVLGIVYSPEKASAVVDHKIVHEGDTVRGVAVLKINEDKVVFGKNGNRWEQAVRQTPDDYWK
jgi:hypothetical protein